MPPIFREVHPLAMKHILGELKRRDLVQVDRHKNPVPLVKKTNRRGEDTQVFSISEQPLIHIIPESTWLIGPGFDILVYPEALATLMEEVIETTSSSVQDEIKADLLLCGRNSPWS